MLHMAIAQAAPTISVNANPLMVPDGQTSGSVLITWDVENDKDGEVWLNVDNNDETRFSGDSKGAEPAATCRDPLAKVLTSVKASTVNIREHAPIR